MKKKINFGDSLLTILGFLLIAYGIYVVFNDSKKGPKKEEPKQEVKFDGDKLYGYLKNYIVPDDIKYDYTLYGSVAISNISEDLIFECDLIDNELEEYTFLNTCIKVTDVNKLIKEIFGDVKITPSSIVYDNNYYTLIEDTLYIYKSAYAIDAIKNSSYEIDTKNKTITEKTDISFSDIVNPDSTDSLKVSKTYKYYYKLTNDKYILEKIQQLN